MGRATKLAADLGRQNPHQNELPSLATLSECMHLNPIPALFLSLVPLCLSLEHAGVDMDLYTSVDSDVRAGKSHFRAPPGENLSDDMRRKVEWSGNKILVPSLHQSYFTRPAAFGLRHVEDEGLWGTLIPIQTFLETNNNYGCIPEASSVHLTNKAHWEKSIEQTVIGKRKNKHPPSDWIALIERGECSFERKVRLAQSMGAKAVVVGDYMEQDDAGDPMNIRVWDDISQHDANMPLVMFPDGDASDISIPSCFVIRSSYLELMEFASSGVRVGPYLDAGLDDSIWEDVGLLIFLLPSIFALSAILLQNAREAVKRFRQRASVYTIKSLPCYRWHSNGTWDRLLPSEVPDQEPKSYALWSMHLMDTAVLCIKRMFLRGSTEQESLIPDTEGTIYETASHRQSGGAMSITNTSNPRWYVQDDCPICLSNFEDGDRVRVLPCGHIFHQDEIDDWLTGTRRLCPTCKQDIVTR